MESTSYPKIIKFSVYSSRRYHIEVMALKMVTHLLKYVQENSTNMVSIDGEKPLKRQYVTDRCIVGLSHLVSLLTMSGTITNIMTA